MKTQFFPIFLFVMNIFVHEGKPRLKNLTGELERDFCQNGPIMITRMTQEDVHGSS